MWYETLKYLIDLFLGLFGIFMTGYPNDSVRARAMKAGAVCFLNKPFDEDHFIGCIEKALKAT